VAAVTDKVEKFASKVFVIEGKHLLKSDDSILKAPVACSTFSMTSVPDHGWKKKLEYNTVHVEGL